LLIPRHLLIYQLLLLLSSTWPPGQMPVLESAKARIFSPRLRSKSQGLSAHQQPLSARRRFRFYFSGQLRILSWSPIGGSGGEKDSTMLCLKNHDLAGGANCFKTTFVSLHCCCFSKDFLSASGCVYPDDGNTATAIPKQPANFFLTSLLKCGWVSIAFIVSWLVSTYFTLFSWPLKKEMSFASHGRENTCSVKEAGFCTISPVPNCCTISDIRHEYLHILLNIYLFIYLIHFGDGDREMIEA